ncbi:hypothetical protein BTVI_77506 [Pitangus sulphuratus]|nr:hypothetical protein BTVI_77506 [Pitangus sulphuratus]
MRSLDLFSLEETEGRSHCSYNFLMRGRGGADIDVFSLVIGDRTRGSGVKLSQGKLMLDIRKRFFIQSTVGHWNAQGSGHSTKPARGQEVFGQCSQAHGVMLGTVQGQELDFSDPCGSLPIQDIL